MANLLKAGRTSKKPPEWEVGNLGYRYAYEAAGYALPHWWTLEKVQDDELGSYVRDAFEKLVHMQQSGKNPKIPVILGRQIDGKVSVEDAATMPHLLVAGATGQGKSNFIRGLLLSNFALSHPYYLRILCLDGQDSTFNFIGKDSLVAEVVHSGQIKDRLKWLKKEEIPRRRKLLEESGYTDLQKFNAHHPNSIEPFLLVYFDEFQLFPLSKEKEKRDVYDELVEIGGICRKYGIHLVFSTQTPYAQVVNGLLKNNLAGRVCFRMETTQASQSVLNGKEAYGIRQKGRMIYKLGVDKTELKTPLITETALRRIHKNALQMGAFFGLGLDL